LAFYIKIEKEFLTFQDDSDYIYHYNWVLQFPFSIILLDFYI